MSTERTACGSRRLTTKEMKPVWIGYETDYLYDGQMPVCEQEFEDGVLKQTRINLLGARGMEGIILIGQPVFSEVDICATKFI